MSDSGSQGMSLRGRGRVPRTATLIAFEAAARYGNISHAARSLGISQSSFSRQIASLENQLQVRLFDRSPAGVKLTEAGRRLYDATVAALGLLEAAVEEVERRLSGDSVIIACSHDFSHLVIMPRYDKLRTTLGEAARVRLQTYHRQIEELAPVGTADIELSWRLPEARSADQVLVLEEWVRPICAPAYAAAHPEMVSGSTWDWGRLTLLDLEWPNPGWSTWSSQGWSSWQDWFGLTGQPESAPRYETYDSYTQLLQAAVVGRGVALGWRYWIESHLEAGTLLSLGDGYLKLPGRFFASLTPQGRKNPLARRCLEFFEQLR